MVSLTNLQSDSPEAAGLLSILDVVLGAVTTVGLGCSPLSAVGLGGNSCSASPVCCENNSFVSTPFDT
jgi:hypothetical protein